MDSIFKKSVQDVATEDFLTEDSQDSNETLQLLEFYQHNAVALTHDQLTAMMILKENKLDDLIEFALAARSHVTPASIFNKVIDKLTMADRIKGNAKLSHLMKANANPANGALKPTDVQAESNKKYNKE